MKRFSASFAVDQHAIIHFCDSELLSMVVAGSSPTPIATPSNDCDNFQCHNDYCVKIEEIVLEVRKQLESCLPI